MSLKRNKVSWVLIVIGFLAFPATLFAQPFQIGEKIIYDIKKMGVSAGQATVEFKGEAIVNNQKLMLIVFSAKGPKFLDEEKIYVEPETFLPIRVERDLNIFGNIEKISEDYDNNKGKVKITKTAGGKTTEQVIEKEGRLENIYGFLYRYRKNGNFQIGNAVKLNLPTKNVTVKIVKQYDIGVGGKTYNSFFMQSDPRRYSIWFDSGSQKLPLRIDGALGMGKTSMMLDRVEYGMPSK